MQHRWHYPSGEATLRCATCGVSGADWFGESCSATERPATGEPPGDVRPSGDEDAASRS